LEESSWCHIRGSKISTIFQEPGLALSPVMRVGDQIAEVIGAHRTGSRKVLKEECEAILNEVRLSDTDRIYRAYPHQLSGGQLHRITIAQALACRPNLVVADEPTRSLDVTIQAAILDVLRSINRKYGSSLIFITHNPALLAGFADRVIVMYAGRIVEDGPVTQVFRHPLHPSEGPTTLAFLSRAKNNASHRDHANSWGRGFANDGVVTGPCSTFATKDTGRTVRRDGRRRFWRGRGQCRKRCRRSAGQKRRAASIQSGERP
jgi:ABC-type dipeptide/oligopeptide/nickel transport system ATPase component